MAKDYGVNNNTPYGQYMKQRDAENRRDFWTKVILPTVGFAVGGQALAALTGSGAASAAAPVANSALGSTSTATGLAPYAPTIAANAPHIAGGIGTAASVPWLRLSEIGAPIASNLVGNYFANRQANKALDAQLAAASRAEQIQIDNENRRRQEWEQQQAMAQKAFEAEQEQARLDRAASDEERTYSRAQYEATEARRAPYRALGSNALLSLANIAGLRSA